MIEVRTPSSSEEWKAYFHLRYITLREPWGQPLGSERDEQDEIAQQFALFENGELKGAGRLDKINATTSQVRYFCVGPDSERKGFGRRIMVSIEEDAKKNGIQKIILHARENTVAFYKSLGYEVVEESYLLFGEIQHWLMEKEILRR